MDRVHKSLRPIRLALLAVATVLTSIGLLALAGPDEAVAALLFGGAGAVGMAVTANQVVKRQAGERASYPVAASTNIYEGTLVFVNASGYADDDIASGVNEFAGVAISQADNSSGSAGDIEVEVWNSGVFELTGSSFTQATVGQDIYATDNYTVTATALAGVYVGRCTKFIDSTTILVEINSGGDPNTQSAVELGDDSPLVLGDGEDAVILWSTGDSSNHSAVIGLGDSNQALHITDKGARATDWNVAADTDPTVYIHSNTTPATDYVKIGAHDGSGAWIADMVGGASLYAGFDGLEALELAETASAVNHVKVTNAATGNHPKIEGAGDDAAVGLEVDSGGTGNLFLQVNGTTECTLKSNNLEVGDAADTVANSVEIFDGGTDKPGMLVLYDHTGSAHYLWVDNTGDLRIHTAVPTDEDMDGTIVGTQA